MSDPIRDALNTFISAYDEEIGDKPEAIPELNPKLHRAAILAKAAFRSDGWVSVKERLPDLPGAYLIVRKGSVAVYVFGGEPGLWADEDVTHWRPLPEPPKGEP